MNLHHPVKSLHAEASASPSPPNALMSSGALDTPPSSDVEASARLPPSPPLSPPKRASASTVDRLIGTLQLLRRGKLESHSDWLTFSITQAEYRQLERRLRQRPALRDWYQGKARYDWGPTQGQLVLRMPTVLHERFTACVEDAIGSAIDSLADDLQGGGLEGAAEVSAELRKIYKGRSTTLQLKVPQLESSSQGSEESVYEEQIVKRSPDATFYHPSQPDYPTLVVEVSYSQQLKDLPRLAESYIIDSSHAIGAVVGFKIPYVNHSSHELEGSLAGDKSTTFSLWRPDIEYIGAQTPDGTRETIGVCSRVETETPIRLPDGSAAPSFLTLRLTDLLPKGLPALECLDVQSNAFNIPVDLKPLVTLLDEAEESLHASHAGEPQLTPASTHVPTKFRKRKRTPSEELSDGREESFLQQEVREQERDTQVDGEYVDRSRRVRRRKSKQDPPALEGSRRVATRSSNNTTTGASGDVG